MRLSCYITSIRACWRGLDLMIVSSLCLIHSESFQGFCHFHLNWSSHWWWLLFHLHSLPVWPTVASFFIDKCPTGTICIHNHLYNVDQADRPNTNEPLSRNITFLVWSRNAADSLTDPLAMPGVNLSCFGAGSDTGDKGPLISSTKCFDELRELTCRSPFKSIRTITKTKNRSSKTKFCQKSTAVFIGVAQKHLSRISGLSQMNKSTKLEGKWYCPQEYFNPD